MVTFCSASGTRLAKAPQVDIGVAATTDRGTCYGPSIFQTYFDGFGDKS